MSKTDQTIKKALALVHPTPEEERALLLKADLIISRTRRAAERYQEIGEVALGGSFAKGTWLPDQADLDVFLKIDPGTDQVRFEEVGLKVGAAATAGYPRGKKYAQHPYTEADMDGVKINIVPCYDVKPPNWKSAADRSPYHVELVKRMPDGQKEQVRLLKLFMKGIGVYGAEIEVEGFSGYAAEVLVIAHGDMHAVLKHFAGIKPEGDGRLFRLPDPVDRGRDLSRAISGEKLARMVLASRQFLSRPSLSYFAAVKPVLRREMRKSIVALVFSHQELSEDTLWGELKRTLRHVQRHVEERGFVVARSSAASNNRDRSALLFIPEFRQLPRLQQRMGPTVDRRAESIAFLTANNRRAKLVWVDEGGRLRTLQDREHTDLDALMKEMVRTGMKGMGASARVGRAIARTGKVLSGEGLKKTADSQPWLAEGIIEIASDTIGTGFP